MVTIASIMLLACLLLWLRTDVFTNINRIDIRCANMEHALFVTRQELKKKLDANPVENAEVVDLQGKIPFKEAATPYEKSQI